MNNNIQIFEGLFCLKRQTGSLLISIEKDWGGKMKFEANFISTSRLFTVVNDYSRSKSSQMTDSRSNV